MSEQATEAKPINSTQAKALREIVDIDFGTIKLEAYASIDEGAERRKEAARNEYSADQLTKARTKLVTLQAKHLEQYRKLIGELREQGITAGQTPYRVEAHPDRLGISGLDQALVRIDREASAAKIQVGNAIERHKLSVLRQVLERQITPGDAQEVLRSLPTAEQIVQEVRTSLAGSTVLAAIGQSDG